MLCSYGSLYLLCSYVLCGLETSLQKSAYFLCLFFILIFYTYFLCYFLCYFLRYFLYLLFCLFFPHLGFILIARSM